MKPAFQWISIFVILICQSAAASAQAPLLLNYQAVVRNGTGAPVANNTPVALRFTMHDTTAQGATVFTETQNTTANQFGLVNVQIGSVTSLSTVTWASAPKFLQVEADVNNTGTFIDMGTTQMISVPYALSAGTASTAWNINGNSGLTDTNFIGHLEPVPLNFRSWNQRAARIEPPGYQYLTSVGYQGLESNVTGVANSAFGYQTLTANTTGNNNTAVGASALENNVANGYNTAIGVNALQDAVADNNVAVGYSALSTNTTGTQNTAVGVQALSSNGTADFNTAVGIYALQNNYGSRNIAFGGEAGKSNTTGEENTALGIGTLYYNATGSYNTAVGYTAGTSNNYDHTISIGNDTYLNGASNQAFIGGSGTLWNGGNVTWSTYSDARVKRDIQEDVKGLDFIKRLRPVTYYRNYNAMLQITGNKDVPDYPGKYDIEKIRFSGFLAQDVELAAKGAGYNFSGITSPKNDKELYTLSYEQFVVPLVKGMQEQQQMIDALNKQNEFQQKEIEELKSLVNGLKQK